MIGKTVGHFEIRAQLGEGGMGVIYRAWDSKLEREVALKFLHTESEDTGNARQRLLLEARAASRLNHPGIVTVYEIGEFERDIYIAMELLEGETLRDRLRRGALGIAEGVAVASQLADALRVAHERGVIHRDFKPANVMLLPEGRVKVLDFGLALVHDTNRITRTGDVLGTPGYMSPEQLLGLEAGIPSDVWALGVVLYEMFSGRLCFARDSLGAVAAAVLYGEPDPLEHLRPDMPAPVMELIARCLAKDAADRPTGMDAILAALSGAALIPPPRRGVRAKLPAELSSFVGREAEIAVLTSRLTKARLVTLTGSGGSGKTRLALRVAHQIAERYEDGAALVDLGSLSEADRLARVIGEALGYAVPSGGDSAEALLEYMSTRRLLLVLDNAEHLVSAVAAFVAKALRRCPGVTIIVTSREALLIEGENAVIVAPLGLPDDASELDAARLLDSDAVRLFVERAQEARPGFVVGTENARDVASICRRLDGIPLAIELAAARLRMLGLDQIAARLSDRFRLLTAGSRDAVPRQKTLRAAIEWSHDLLVEEERVVFRRLAAFAGGWTLEAAEEVVGDETVSSMDVLDLLEKLVLKSLVVFSGESGEATASEPRYRFLESIREHASERLAAAADREGTLRRHLEWCLKFAAARRLELGGSGQAEALHRLESEHANLLVALDRAHADPAGGREELKLADALSTFWSTRGYAALGRMRLEAALERTGGLVNVDRAQAWLGAGHLARIAGDFAAGEDRYARGLALARELGDRLLEGRALNGIGGICTLRSDFQRAAEYYTEALEIHRALGDQQGIARALNNLAIIALERGEHDRAAQLYEESLAVTKAIGDVRQMAIALYNIGYLAITRGELEGAIQSLDESIVHFRRLGHRQGTAMATMSLGKAWVDRGDPSRGNALLNESLAMAERLDDRMVRGHALMFMGEAALARETLEPAIERLVRSLVIFREMGSANEICDVLERFVRLLALQHRFVPAATLLGAVDHLRARVGHPLNPSEREGHASLLQTLNAELAGGAFERAQVEGIAMDLETAAEYARAAVTRST